MAKKLTVRTWYDRQSRNWISQVVNEKGWQIGDSIYDGTKAAAQRSHEYLRHQIREGRITDDY